MNDEQQAVEVAEEQPVATPQVEIDYERITEGLAERLRPQQPEPAVDNFDEMDWEQRDKYTLEKTNQVSQQLQQMSIQQQAFMRSGEAEEAALKLIPENLRGEARGHVKAYIGQVMASNPGAIANGLPENLADEIASMASGKVLRAGKVPTNEPKAQVNTTDIPFYDEIATALKESGLPVTHEEIVRRSKTWGGTRAS